MMIKAESYKIFSEIYCPIVPAPLELYFGDGCRSEYQISGKMKLERYQTMSGKKKLHYIKEIKLRDFQFKIYNRILVTNSFLYKIKK